MRSAHSSLRTPRWIRALAPFGVSGLLLGAMIGAAPTAASTLGRALDASALRTAAATAASEAPASGPADLQGTLEVVHSDDFATGHAGYDYHLRTASERLALHISGAVPDGFVSGARVRVHGQRDGQLVAVGTSAAEVISAPVSPSLGAKRIAVLMVNFSNNTTQPFSRTYVNSVFFGSANSVRAYFAEESHGLVSLSGTVFGWFRIPYSSTTCDWSGWNTAAKAAAVAHGIDLSVFTNVVVAFPHTSACAWSGMGWLPGSDSWLNGAPTVHVAAHELSHNFGVHHASSLRCTSNGVRVALSSSCTRSEYGDPFTVMGYGAVRHDDNQHLVSLGYLPTSAMLTVTASRTLYLMPAETSTGLRVIAIPRGDGTFFYLEYRRPYGTYFDNFSSTDPVVGGITIRISSAWSTVVQSKLIDTVPSTTTFKDAPLRTGRTFRDFQSRIAITAVYATSTHMKLTITFPADTTAPTAVGSFAAAGTSATTTGLAWTPASDNRAVAGYRIWRNSTLIATTSAATTSLIDSNLVPATAYTYTIRAFDVAGNQGPGSLATATTAPIDTAPTSPTRLALTLGGTSASLSWSAASDNVGVSSYRINRDGAFVGSTTGLTFHDVGLTPSTAYTWTVTAIDTAGQPSPATTISGTTPAIDTTAPSAPMASATGLNGSWVSLTWTAATDNVGVTGYVVYRDGSVFSTVGASTLQLRVSTGATYWVVAVDGAGNNSAPSNSVSI